MPDARYITVTTANPPLSVTARRGIEPPIPTGGYGGWSEVDRPRRTSLTEWAGISPQRELVTLLLDGVRGDRSVEPDCRKLEQMARPPAAGGEPPLVRVLGAVPHRGVNWVIEDIEWDTDPLYSSTAGGYRIRQGVKLHLLKYVADDRLDNVPAAERARRAAATKAAAAVKGSTAPAKTGAKTYIVKSGDTLISIAARLLGNYKRYQEIADLNGIRDPDRITVGQKLRLP